jgi:hypothetical protein
MQSVQVPQDPKIHDQTLCERDERSAHPLDTLHRWLVAEEGASVDAGEPHPRKRFAVANHEIQDVAGP